jgi:hypothetical protein
MAPRWSAAHFACAESSCGCRMMSTLSQRGTNSRSLAPRQIPRREQSARGLRVCEQQQVCLAHRPGVGARKYPLKVPTSPTRHVPGLYHCPRTLDERRGRVVDDGGDSACPGELEQVAEQAESGYVGGASDSGGERQPASLVKCRGAKRGANHAKYWATSGHSQPRNAQLNGTSGHTWPPLATVRMCLLSSGSRVRILPGAPGKTPSHAKISKRLTPTFDTYLLSVASLSRAGLPCPSVSLMRPSASRWAWRSSWV